MISKTLFFCSIIFGLFAFQVEGAAPRIYTENPDRIALEGYDVITYFTQGKPLMGDPKYEMEWEGAKWHFRSQFNLNKFAKNPRQYAPQYGGYCPWAIANGRLTGGIPTLWRIVDGKLYLLCSDEAMEKWNKALWRVNRQADQYWPAILNKGN